MSESIKKWGGAFMFDDYNGNFRDDELSGTLTPNVGNTAPRNGQKVVLPVLTPDRIEKRQNGRRFKDDGEEAFTLTSQDRHGVAVTVDVVGNYSPSGYESARILNPGGIAPTLKENHGTINGVTVEVREATKRGHATARGGETPSTSQCPEAQQDADESG